MHIAQVDGQATLTSEKDGAGPRGRRGGGAQWARVGGVESVVVVRQPRILLGDEVALGAPAKKTNAIGTLK